MQSSAMVNHLEATYPANATGLAQALSDLDCHPQAPDWGEKLAYSLRLVLEELAINIVTHGGQPIDAGWFSVTLTHDTDRTTLTLRDAGQPFDPCTPPQPVLDLPLTEREPGGLGLHLTRALASEMHHVRERGINQTTVLFIHPSPHD